ncbi:MAG TPA: chromate resistance protein ChrB domain-containing protein [Chthonomonadaceae bacterium]|nr:chromate resistance protein ChrB domain-containing protein [Chthonomonadaceae bacterium]
MRYCTRRNVHVDRCASAWLIRKYLDPDAEFVFVDGQTPIPDTVPFDMHGVEWGHHGDRCTFETIAALRHLDDPVIRQIGQIIHGADILADADVTLESAGIDLLFKGLRLVSDSDEQAIERGFLIMDALAAAVKNRHA